MLSQAVFVQFSGSQKTLDPLQGLHKRQALALPLQFLISRPGDGARKVAFQTKPQVTGAPEAAGPGTTLGGSLVWSKEYQPLIHSFHKYSCNATMCQGLLDVNKPGKFPVLGGLHSSVGRQPVNKAMSRGDEHYKEQSGVREEGYFMGSSGKTSLIG